MDLKKAKKLQNEKLYIKKMKEMDEFQDMLYKEKENKNIKLLPKRSVGRRNQTLAQKRLEEIDKELNQFLEVKKVERENSADI